MSLKHSYTILSPVYDAIVSKATLPMRRDSIAQLGDVNGKHILLSGVGTGLDLPLLPPGARYTGIDLTPAMLKRAHNRRPPSYEIELQLGDAMQLEFSNQEFDMVIMHLILAVVPEPGAALREASRVLKTGGKIHILDKFIRPGKWAPGRRLLNLFMRHIATRTDVVFEELLAQQPELTVISDEPCFPGGWFRRIIVEKAA